MTQYSTFYLGDRYFGLPIGFVREIIQSCRITPVPLAPPQVRGLINLRGQIVTILDLAVRLGMPARSAAPGSHVIVLSAEAEAFAIRHRRESKEAAAGENMAGFLVDRIGDVVEADPSRLEPPPANVLDAQDHAIQGVFKTGGGLLVLLDLPAVLGGRSESEPA